MKKINWTSPRYVIPLIILPFLFGFNWMWIDSFAASSEPLTAMEEMEILNSNIPEANLNKREVSTKFEAVKDAFKQSTDYTAINDLEQKRRALKLEQENKYTDEEKLLIDSINNSIMGGTRKNFMQAVNDRNENKTTGYRPSDKKSPADPKQTQSVKVTSNHNDQQDVANESKEDKELRLWKKQMLMLDSLTKSPEQRAAEKALRLQEKALTELAEEQAREKEKIVKVSKAGYANERHFNTIRKKEKETYIKAIIDEDIKVVDGSRVRIRIMDDIDVGGYILEKGAYIFANVSGFSAQRLKISVASILVDNKIMDVKLEVFDYDGLEGLYVPSSSFTEFSKDLGGGMASGSGSNINIEQRPGNLNQLLFGMADDGIQTTSKAASKAAKKNRAKLKYNTIIYLVNPDQI